MKNKEKVARELLRIRQSQILVNEMYKNGEFKIPIHLALGHEAIAVAVDNIMKKEDSLVLSHRNIHYNLARLKALKPEIDEYLLKESGLAKGQLGSMNLANEEDGVIYTSSILGNNLPVSAGIALGKKLKSEAGVTIVETGDGAMEEGTFYETLVFAKYVKVPLIIIIENNQWSLASTIEERRCPIDISKMASSVGAGYKKLSSNDVYEYIEELDNVRDEAVSSQSPICIEVELKTLGYSYQKQEGYPGGEKFINYHGGPSPTVKEGDLYMEESDRDPVYVLQKYFKAQELEDMSKEILTSLKGEIQ
ncbi:hypothetical protein KJ577_00535 [bacterium]|nr:hypothetical protein [bacterium]